MCLYPSTGDCWHKRGALNFKTIGLQQCTNFWIIKEDELIIVGEEKPGGKPVRKIIIW
jgi:hypothetical protein